jgi:hypothetical protein
MSKREFEIFTRESVVGNILIWLVEETIAVVQHYISLLKATTNPSSLSC